MPGGHAIFSDLAAMSARFSVLLVEDGDVDAKIVQGMLRRANQDAFSVQHVLTLREAITRIYEEPLDAVLLDLSVPDSNGIKGVSRIREAAPDLPIVALIDEDDEASSLGAIRCGAQECLSKEHIMGGFLDRVIRHSIARQQQLGEAKAQALIDPLTRIGNQRALDLELRKRHAEAKRYRNIFSIVLLDIDHLKSVNDRFGHEAGDEVLRSVSRVLAGGIRDTDLATRHGGEEFGIVMPATKLEEAWDAAEFVRAQVADLRWELQGTSIGVSVSAGVAQLLHHDDEPALVQRADEALDAAKNAGRNRCFWHDGAGCFNESCAPGEALLGPICLEV